ncbi:hypothetical protein U1Q18_049712 [Sarracenia purpurea var. burkii]
MLTQIQGASTSLLTCTASNISMEAEIYEASTPLPTITGGNILMLAEMLEAGTPLLNSAASNIAVSVSIPEAVYKGQKRINFRISTICNMSFYVKRAELLYGSWYKEAPLQNATDSEINSIAIDLMHDGIFGVCRTPFAPNTTKGFFHIDLENKTHLLEQCFELGDGTDDISFSTEIKPGFGSRDRLRCFCRTEDKFIGDEVYVNLTMELVPLCQLVSSASNILMVAGIYKASTPLPAGTASNIAVPVSVFKAVSENTLRS